MQKDMHFYGVYALARAAGIKDEAAETMAYASQFVDDAVDQGIVFVSDSESVLPTMTSHKPIDYQNAIPNDQWNVWVPFHFLPGNVGAPNDFYERMTCQPGSGPASAMLDSAINESDDDIRIHRVGIAAHVFADTFSHYGFIGLCSDNNKVGAESIKPDIKHSSGILNYMKAKLDEFTTRFAGGAAEAVPVGHGAVGTFPDRPFLSWEYQYESGGAVIKRNNADDFLKACEQLHSYFIRYKSSDNGLADPYGPKQWQDILSVVSSLLSIESPLEERVDAWKKATADGKFSNASAKDKAISYSEDLWRPRRAAYAGGGLKDSDACRFIRAAHRHRDYVLRELLPSIGLLTQ